MREGENRAMRWLGRVKGKRSLAWKRTTRRREGSFFPGSAEIPPPATTHFLGMKTTRGGHAQNIFSDLLLVEQLMGGCANVRRHVWIWGRKALEGGEMGSKGVLG